MEKKNDVCFDCGGEFVKNYEFDTGYGTDKDGHKICFKCCGKRDLKELENLNFGEIIVQYLHVENPVNAYRYTKGDISNEKYTIQNWPGSLKIKATGCLGYHNIARIQRNIWFVVGEKYFHGVQYGDFSELCYIKRVKPWK